MVLLNLFLSKFCRHFSMFTNSGKIPIGIISFPENPTQHTRSPVTALSLNALTISDQADGNHCGGVCALTTTSVSRRFRQNANMRSGYNLITKCYPLILPSHRIWLTTNSLIILRWCDKLFSLRIPDVTIFSITFSHQTPRMVKITNIYYRSESFQFCY